MLHQSAAEKQFVDTSERVAVVARSDFQTLPFNVESDDTTRFSMKARRRWCPRTQ